MKNSENKINLCIKTTTLLLCLLIISLTFCSCKSSTANDEKQVSEKSDTIHSEANTDGDIYFPTKNNVSGGIDASMESPKDMNDLYEKAPYIIVCSILTDDTQIKYKDLIPMSISSAKIEKVLKGDLNVGDIINIQETGTRGDNVDISVGGTPLLRKGMKVLLFLSGSNDIIMNGETSFGIQDCYYGKFFYDNSNVLYSAADYVNDGSPKLSDFTAPMNETALLSKINEIALSVKNDKKN